MWICLNCNKRLLPREVTYQETCDYCKEKVYTEKELKNYFNKYCSFRIKHDLYNIQEKLKDIKKKS